MFQQWILDGRSPTWKKGGKCPLAPPGYAPALLLALKESRIGCTLGGVYVGAFAYADDVVLLAPCLSSLRLMLGLCEEYAVCHGPSFNPLKTQLIQFRWYSHLRVSPTVTLCVHILPLMDEVLHLGHILLHNLSDEKDILHKCKDMIRKANALLCSFTDLSPVVLTYLFSIFCLPYGISPRHLSSLWKCLLIRF